MVVLIIFPVILQTDINVIMLYFGGQGADGGKTCRDGVEMGMLVCPHVTHASMMGVFVVSKVLLCVCWSCRSRCGFRTRSRRLRMATILVSQYRSVISLPKCNI